MTGKRSAGVCHHVRIPDTHATSAPGAQLSRDISHKVSSRNPIYSFGWREPGFHLFDFLVQRYEIGKLRRRRTVEKFLVINQSYSFQSDRIPPNPPIVKHSLPGLREKSVSKFFGNLDRPDQSGVCPFADLIVRPNDNVGALRHLRSNWETVCNLLGGLDRDFESKI